MQDLNNFNLGDFSWGSGGYTPGGTGTSGGGGGGTGGTGGGGGGPACFELGTCFRMADGSLKKIEDIKPRDEMELGGNVYVTRVGDASEETWYDVDGVHVTGSHGMYKDDEWIRVRDAGYEEIDHIDTFYTLNNDNHRMVAENGQVFLDYDEIDMDLEESGWEDYIIEKLNGRVEGRFEGDIMA